MSLEILSSVWEGFKNKEVQETLTGEVKYEEKFTFGTFLKLLFLAVNQWSDLFVAFHSRDLCNLPWYTFGWYWNLAAFYTVLHGCFFDSMRAWFKIDPPDPKDWQVFVVEPRADKRPGRMPLVKPKETSKLNKLIYYTAVINPWPTTLGVTRWILNNLLMFRFYVGVKNAVPDMPEGAIKWLYDQEKEAVEKGFVDEASLWNLGDARDVEDMLHMAGALTGDLPNLGTLAVIYLYKRKFDAWNFLSFLFTLVAIVIRVLYGTGVLSQRSKDNAKEALDTLSKEAGESHKQGVFLPETDGHGANHVGANHMHDGANLHNGAFYFFHFFHRCMPHASDHIHDVAQHASDHIHDVVHHASQ
jgi:hypothetical protein